MVPFPGRGSPRARRQVPFGVDTKALRFPLTERMPRSRKEELGPDVAVEGEEGS